MAASSSSVTLDLLDDFELVEDAAPQNVDLPMSSPSPTDLELHLTYPTYIIEDQDDVDNLHQQNAQRSHQTKNLLKDRLYVGNLHPSVDEYALLHIFSKFGKVTKLDYLFHKSGPLKGKPRGYAFVEYGQPEEATKALEIAHNKLLRGRKIIVTFAHQAPLDQNMGSASGSKHRRTMDERRTTLSIIKTGLVNRHEPKTADKIALMEAKLRQIEASKETESPSGSSLSTLLHHPSLPKKPPPPLPTHIIKALQQTQMAVNSSFSDSPIFPAKPQIAKPKSTLPSLPMKPQSSLTSTTGFPPSLKHQLPFLPKKPETIPLPPKPSGVSTHSSISGGVLVGTAKSKKLAGVIIKPKTKEKDKNVGAQ